VIAYNNDAALKERLIATMRAHREAETLVQGVYWEDGRGCAVGCITHKQSYEAWKHYEEWGIPRILARLEDAIFEALPTDEARAWPERFLGAIQPGADLSQVWDRFAVWLLVDPTWGVLQFARTDAQRVAIQRVADLYARRLEGTTVALSDWEAARRAAYAAYAAAYAAAAADAAYAAADAAYAAADAAAYAAYAAADAAAYAAYAARLKWRRAQADKLIELLEAA
jgi:hypothetical protein